MILYYKHEAESSLGEGIVFMAVDVDADQVIKQVEVYGGEIFWSVISSQSDDRFFIADQPASEIGLSVEHQIEQIEFEEVWRKAISHMQIEFKDGDLFSTPGITAFAHGCNCAGAMGKGIAVTFKERWPQMYTEYRQRCLDEVFKPGDVFVWEEQGKHIFNLGTQKTWRTKATLDAVVKSLTTMTQLAEEIGVEEIALPRIGAGLGGLHWEDVKAAMLEVAKESSVFLLVCENFVAGQSMR